MEGGVEMLHHYEEESGLVQSRLRPELRGRRTSNLLLAVICFLLCTCIVGVPTAYILIRNCNAETERAIQIQNRNLPNVMAQKADVDVNHDGRPRAHLTVGRGNWQETSKEKAIQWEDSMSLAFTKNGMKYRKPCLEIPMSGDYFVYAQAMLKGESNCPKDSRSKYSLSIQKISSNYPEPEVLLSSIESLYTCRWLPIYLGAVVKLREGDRLVVNASDIKMIDTTREQRTFFGAFLI